MWLFEFVIGKWIYWVYSRFGLHRFLCNLDWRKTWAVVIAWLTTTCDITVNQNPSPLKLWVRIPFMAMCTRYNICDKVCQWLAADRWFSPVSSPSKADHHNITEILKKMALNPINITIEKKSRQPRFFFNLNYRETCVNRTLSKPKTWQNQTDLLNICVI
jgi:hypothetical protein